MVRMRADRMLTGVADVVTCAEQNASRDHTEPASTGGGGGAPTTGEGVNTVTSDSSGDSSGDSSSGAADPDSGAGVRRHNGRRARRTAQ